MTSSTEIAIAQLSRLVGVPDAPLVIDVRTPDDFAADPRLIPGAIRLPHETASSWASRFRGRRVVVSCQRGLKLSQGTAAWLRHEGADAESLEGGHEAWRAAAQPLAKLDALPARDPQGRTVWVTRTRPKVDRIACPWLIRRFLDRDAVFLFVDASQVMAVAERFVATPFDVEGVTFTHRGDRCTFDTMLEVFGLDAPPLQRLATIVRGADTDRLDLAPEAAGLLAASLGLSRMYKDDLVQLDQGLALYDAFYRWARDAHGETHNWPAGKQSS
jgi:rhodanese-related sulfurtransferase